MNERATDTDEKAWNIDDHRRALLLSRRCSRCAELVKPQLLFRGLTCPRCESQLEWPSQAKAESLIDAVQGRWKRRRLIIYALVAIAAGLTGFLPIVPTIVTVVFLVVLRHTFLREPMQWFSPGRRFITGFVLKMWLATVSCVTLVLNALLALIPFANMPLNAVACLGTTALFAEVALFYLVGRLRRESEHGPELETWEWGVPVLLTGLAVALGSAAIGAVIFTMELVSGYIS